MNLFGFVGGEQGQGPSVRLGLGEVIRRVARGLERADIPFATIPYRPSSAETAVSLADAVYDTNLICLNADYLGRFLTDARPDFFADKMSIGFWFWETSRLRLDPGTPLACLDEVWVASTYARDAVAPVIDIPVHVAPLPMEAPAVPLQSRSELGLPDDFLFLFTFNFVSGVRKNPLATLDAFTRAFAAGEGPVLVLKSVNGRQRKPRLLDEVERAARGRPDVLVLDRYVSEEENQAIIACCDCYVSLHRSEGLGLTIAEAIARGKPVIATGYSGNLDFMSEESSYLVPYRLSPIPSDWWAYMPGAEWAEPDIVAAAELMRRVWERPEEARARGMRGRDELLERFTVDRTADFLSRRLAELRIRSAFAARMPGRGARKPILEASALLRTDIGESLVRPKSGGRSRIRAVLRRALWPYLERERALETATLDALAAHQRALEYLEQRVRRLEAPSGRRDTEGEGID